MSRFDIYPSQSTRGYLLDLQSDFLAVQSTRVIVPLLPENDLPERIRMLHPVFEIEGEMHVMATHLIATVPLSRLAPVSGNLSAHADQITRALDLLFQGH